MTLHGVVTLHRHGSKALTVALLLLASAAAVIGGSAEWVRLTAADTVLLHFIPALAGAVAGVGWAAVGAVLAWLRPGNVLGWIMLGVGTLTQLGLAEESFAHAGGHGVLDPGALWHARPGAVALSAATGFAIYVMLGLLPVLYPSGRWPGRAWTLPVAAVVTGAALLQIQWTAAILAPPPGSAAAPAPHGLPDWVVLVPGVIFALGLLATWVMCVVRLVRAGQPERAQLLWLVATVAALVATQSTGGSVPALWLQTLCLYLLPAAIAVGILRYRLLGIEAVLRRGLVYGTLTACIVVVYAAAMVAAGVHLTGQPLVAVVGAALVAVGLSPLRMWLQRGVDALLYGRRPDPMAAVSRLGMLAAGAAEPELLHVVLTGVQHAVKAPYARIVEPDGGTLAHVGRAGTGPAPHPGDFAATLTIGNLPVGRLEVGGRTPGERYPTRDEQTLRAMAPQLAAVVHSLALATQLQEQRDAVVAATGRERERLRQDLHDGLGPSLTGVGLGLQALADTVAEGVPCELVQVLRREIDLAVAEVRRILEDLGPGAMDGQSIAQALPQRIAAVAGQLRTAVTIAPLPALPPPVAEATYLVASEAVANAARHANASMVRVEVLAADGTLMVNVYDDGCGLPAHPTPGIGLASMRARALNLGGALELSSSAAGTTVALTLPLTGPGTAAADPTTAADPTAAAASTRTVLAP